MACNTGFVLLFGGKLQILIEHDKSLYSSHPAAEQPRKPRLGADERHADIKPQTPAKHCWGGQGARGAMSCGVLRTANSWRECK